MTDQALDILKLVLLGLLYLFFARVLWAVWSEVRAANNRSAQPHPVGPPVDEAAATVAAPAPGRRRDRPPKGRAGRVNRLVIIEPKSRRGATFPLGTEITVGRDPACTITIEATRSCRACTFGSTTPTARRWSRTSARPTARSTTAPD